MYTAPTGTPHSRPPDRVHYWWIRLIICETICAVNERVLVALRLYRWPVLFGKSCGPFQSATCRQCVDQTVGGDAQFKKQIHNHNCDRHLGDRVHQQDIAVWPPPWATRFREFLAASAQPSGFGSSILITC